MWLTCVHLAPRFFASVFDEAYMNKKDATHSLHTRIRGVWYDLAKFDHPGGPIALHLCEGRDGTALFESHHYLIASKRLYAILNKYKVDEKLQVRTGARTSARTSARTLPKHCGYVHTRPSAFVHIEAPAGLPAPLFTSTPPLFTSTPPLFTHVCACVEVDQDDRR